MRTCALGPQSSSPSSCHTNRRHGVAICWTNVPCCLLALYLKLFHSIWTVRERLLSKRTQMPSTTQSQPWCCRGGVATAELAGLSVRGPRTESVCCPQDRQAPRMDRVRAEASGAETPRKLKAPRARQEGVCQVCNAPRDKGPVG